MCEKTGRNDPMNRFTWATAIVLVMLTEALGGAPRAQTTDAPPPDGVQQILPRGEIPAVFDPEFVPAADAEIPADAWVLGVAIDGVAKAYSLNLLNQHEVVNDRFGEHVLAAVW